MSRSIGENLKKKSYSIFSNYLPLQIWTSKIFNHDISKTITARSFKLKKKVILFFSNYLPLKIWTLKNCNHYISKTITARSFKLGQLIEDDKWINW